MPGPVYLSGERVELRVPEREDVDFLQHGPNNPALRTPLTFTEPQTRDQVEDFYENVVAEDNGDVCLLICPSGEDPVGEIDLFGADHDRGEIAYWLVPEAQGEGYATEALSLLLEYAFDTRGLHRVFGKTADFNEESHRLLERLGFSEEGRLRDHLFLDGEYRDTVFYGLLREEWNET